ncbi:MAG: FUSC family protein [Nocardioides sp.]
MTGHSPGSWVRAKWDDPVFWSEVIQVVKTAAAAVIAWLIATRVFELPQSFLAPWAALLVVHSTVYRSVSQGARQVVAAVAGVLLAWAVGNVLGLDTTSVSVVLLLGLVIGAFRWFGEERITVAATALIVLTTGFSDDDSMLLSRLADTAIGIMVGLAVNLLVWPPLRQRTAIAAMDALDNRIGQLLVDMADGLEAGLTRERADAWLERTRKLDEELDRAWALVRQASESAWMNPRRSAGGLRDPRAWVDLLQRVEQAVAEVRSMTRTLSRGLIGEEEWQRAFLDGYVALLRAAGHAICAADPEPIRQCHDQLDTLAGLVDRESSAPRLWPVYGGLLTNLRNVLDAMDEVAAANPMDQPPMPFRRSRT